jgi:prepilin-type N-terminal cleavage/methylation domain-containing protein
MQTKSHRKTPRTRAHAAFTLIEMLVVVIVIAILAGLVLAIVSGMGDSRKAITIERIEKVRACLEEFYAEYGQYPPVKLYPRVNGTQPFEYEYPVTNGMPRQDVYTYVWQNENDPYSGSVFKFGLMSFLVTRYEGRADNVVSIYPNLLPPGNPQWGPDHNQVVGGNIVGDQVRDKRAMRRWLPFLFEPNITTTEWGPEHSVVDGSQTRVWTNSVITVKDGWGQTLHYKSPPPYATYDIWSDGPDGASGTSDDIHSRPGN